MNYCNKSPTSNCVGDFIQVFNESGCPCYFVYVGKASYGNIRGPGSRQETSFREHLPVDDRNRVSRDSRVRVISGPGRVAYSASFFYHRKSEVLTFNTILNFIEANPKISIKVLNIAEPNGDRDENSYMHVYAVSNKKATSKIVDN